MNQPNFNRRDLLKCLAAGGVVTASGLWWPGQKLISIPKPSIRTAYYIKVAAVNGVPHFYYRANGSNRWLPVS